MDWIKVGDKLPEIPKGEAGVKVLVALFDHFYEEINPGHGYAVGEAFYAPTTGPDGETLELFSGTSKEFDFMEPYVCSNCVEWGPTGDVVTHWMYFQVPVTPDDYDEWTTVANGLPVVPNGNYGVAILAVLDEPTNDGNITDSGYSVSEITYGVVSDENGGISPVSEETKQETDFKKYTFADDGRVEGRPLRDSVICWRYLPQPPRV